MSQDDINNLGCDGPDSMFVKLIASDGHEFVIKRKNALLSNTINAMLSGPGVFAKDETNEIHFREIPSHILQKVCEYLAYKSHYAEGDVDIPEFTIPPEMATELLLASNFLDC